VRETRALLVAVVAAVGTAALGAAAPAYADDTVTVQGTAFPDPARAQLSLVGCGDLYQRAAEPLVPRIGLGPGAAPDGSRSLGFDLAGGNAVGALYTVDSMLSTTTASLAVNAVGRSTGVAYAGYQEPADAGTTLLWLGRSELVTPGGAWQTVEATTRSYTWAKFDMTTRKPVAEGPGAPATVAEFAQAHGGDGPGVYTIGFGCDGAPFSMDSMRVGSPGAVRTYDLEGLRTSVTIAAPSGPVHEGDEVTITGRLHTQTGDPVPHPTMVLEQRRPGSDRWTPVRVAEVGPDGVRATVKPEPDTAYRWRFVGRPVAEGSASATLLITVLPSLPTRPPGPEPTSPPSPGPTSAPSQVPSSPPSPSPSDAPEVTPTPSPTAAASPSSSASESADPGSPASSGDAAPSATDSASSAPRHR
jgi:hypothetical protein